MFKTQRLAIGWSQSTLARNADVARVKICLEEKGDVSYTPAEAERIRVSLQRELDRLRALPETIDELVAA